MISIGAIAADPCEAETSSQTWTSQSELLDQPPSFNNVTQFRRRSLNDYTSSQAQRIISIIDRSSFTNSNRFTTDFSFVCSLTDLHNLGCSGDCLLRRYHSSFICSSVGVIRSPHGQRCGFYWRHPENMPGDSSGNSGCSCFCEPLPLCFS